MIKLNNKNITYVALADTNNSIKAPKEIWYADTNNSVKLVYRRKDALIEGEDYEKYHWLVGDADAYINTLKYYRPYDDSVQLTFRDNLYPNRESKYNKHNVEEQIWGACGNNYVQSIIRSYIAGTQLRRIANNIINATTTEGGVNWASYNVQSDINESSEHSLYISSVDANTDKYYFIYNGSTKDNLPTIYTLPELVQQDVRIFRSGLLNNDYFNGSFFNFIHYRNNVEITHLIPCKLLKPVPKWLDANGIRRQVGECGMIDLVSGKFYGNVNSVGTFTVENYYERKEWLSVTTPSQTNTYLTLSLGANNNFSFKRVWTSDFSNTWYFYTINYVYFTDTKKLVRVYDSINNTDIDAGDSSTISTNDIIEISSTKDELLFNGISINRYGYGRSTTLCIRNVNPIVMSLLTSKVNVNGVERYIPCTLTMDLPASMDANNIARTKGTSGMWDLVSDKFYGNVANSGTFKAVNLAEGVDYEVHQWLRCVFVGFVKDAMYLPVNSYSFVFSRKPLKGSNVPYFRTEGGDIYLYSTTNDTIRIWNSTQYGYYYSGTSFNWGDTISIVSFSDSLEVNSQVIPQNTFPCKYVYFGANDTNGAEHYTSKITVDGIERYIPVKLLRSIPSKYDANGIARQAGECGMYDTVNDLFYGNVASSGSFTVEDDN